MLHRPVLEDIRLKVEQGYTLTHRVLADDKIADYTVTYTVDHWICDGEIIRILGSSDVTNGILILSDNVTRQLHGTYVLNVRYEDNNTPEILTQFIYVDIYK